MTAHRSSVVNRCVTGNFTSPTEQNLILAKCNRLVIYTLTAEGLQPVLDTPIYGRISNLELYRINGAEKDLLFLMTERWKFCILEYNSSTNELITKAMGDVSDRIGKPVDSGQIAHIDPDKRMIGLHIYDGFFKVVPIDAKGVLKEAFNIRLEELQVIDLQFLHGCAAPTILLLYQDSKEMRHLKTYEVTVYSPPSSVCLSQSLSLSLSSLSHILPPPSSLPPYVPRWGDSGGRGHARRSATSSRTFSSLVCERGDKPPALTTRREK